VKKTQKTKEKNKKPVQSKSHNETGKDAGWEDTPIQKPAKSCMNGW
jgi:hypothetical protein